MTRFVPEGEQGIPLSRVRYSNLHSSLKAIIGPDRTEHELLEMIVITMNKINIHLMDGSDIDPTEDDISWP